MRAYCLSRPLVDIVFFGISLLDFSLNAFKTNLLCKGFYTLIKNASFSSPTPQPMWNLTIHPLWGSVSSLALVPFSNRCGTPQSTGAYRPCWHTASCSPPPGLSLLVARCPMSDSDTICNNSIPPVEDIVLFELSLLRFPSRFLKRVY